MFMLLIYPYIITPAILRMFVTVEEEAKSAPRCQETRDIVLF
jgi:hypothetical protein